MKKQLLIVLSLILSFGALAQKDPVLLEINGKPVTKSEFLQIYLKNNNDPKYDKVSLDEYLELFKKFKLKVAEAEALGYDTIPKLKKELNGYRKQLALPYLIDSAKNEALVKEAYDRTKNEVRASHILIRLESNASPADTLSAYNRIMSLKKRIENGEAFENVAKGKNGSDDPSAANNGGDVGFFTAFQMVYPFEDMAYNTPVNNISEPFRTRFGYHILKVTDKRPARGTIKTAHIMVAVSKDASKDDIQAAEKKINELHEKLKAGENFEALASDHSDDPSTSNKGGVLPQFGTGTTTRMVPVFEDVAFSLKNDGDFSSPVRTEYGFHIIKRLEWKDVQAFTEMKKELQGRVNKDERSKKTQDSFVSKLKNEYGYKDYSKKALKWFIKNIDSTYYVGKWNADKLKSNKPVFTLGKEKFTQQQFADYMEVNFRNVRKDDAKVVIKQQFLAWEKEAILASEEGKLAGKHPEFKALVNEYHDGILLYEIMTDKVWNKAMKDTTGLREFFNVNRSKYMWGNRVDAVVYECLNMDIANEVTKMLKNDTINSKHVLDKINKDSELNLRVRTNKFDKESTSFLKGRDMKIGLNKAFELDGKFYIIKVTELLDPKEKEFSEAKGAATSDYQNYLEKNWLEELAKKHAIKINYDVLYSLGK
ncbi:MAG: peptidyl-prolyl cis-trans isomerase [Crocinitomicaceae bacterium]|jgi:peptidyl-prolyl cis-trans isomerase SurA|nr:peptidyl-prolyl cis-trans isomerase [Crocinitomicaceae bacterium]MDP4865827.1 peptidyl-prolyl cis-trans isomerase [Crocinitomicaceae bacterium]MDP5011072.1 peptidyl-prolyl cis-trans isomerase [Crocinitomicaceae bacterium]MDP5099538.1 peptidyl-prolyl cis-trans isomerase [Crocinitomicaceae bacterium]